MLGFSSAFIPRPRPTHEAGAVEPRKPRQRKEATSRRFLVQRQGYLRNSRRILEIGSQAVLVLDLSLTIRTRLEMADVMGECNLESGACGCAERNADIAQIDSRKGRRRRKHVHLTDAQRRRDICLFTPRRAAQHTTAHHTRRCGWSHLSAPQVVSFEPKVLPLRPPERVSHQQFMCDLLAGASA